MFLNMVTGRVKMDRENNIKFSVNMGSNDNPEYKELSSEPLDLDEINHNAECVTVECDGNYEPNRIKINGTSKKFKYGDFVFYRTLLMYVENDEWEIIPCSIAREASFVKRVKAGVKSFLKYVFDE